MKTGEHIFRRIPWGALLAVAIGVLLFLLGAWRFFVGHQFGGYALLYCCLALVPAGVLLLVLDYVLHHAPLAGLLVILLAAVLIFSSPVFDVALGAALIGSIAIPAVREWRQLRRV